MRSHACAGPHSASGQIGTVCGIAGLDNTARSEEGQGVTHPNTRSRTALAGLALLAAGATAAQAQSIVVRSTGPSATSHPKGQRLPQGAVLTLRAGDIVTILDKVGTRVLRGPGTFRLDGAVVRDNGMAARLARSLGDPASFRSTRRAGAVRGLGSSKEAAAPMPDTIWLADVDAGGPFCVPQGSRAYLWRSSTGTGRSGSLATADDRVKINVQWPAQAAGSLWPVGALPLTDGVTYRFTAEGPVSSHVDFRIVSLDPAKLPGDAAGLGALLLDKGCTVQFDWLASSLARLAGTPPNTGG